MASVLLNSELSITGINDSEARLVAATVTGGNSYLALQSSTGIEFTTINQAGFQHQDGNKNIININTLFYDKNQTCFLYFRPPYNGGKNVTGSIVTDTSSSHYNNLYIVTALLPTTDDAQIASYSSSTLGFTPYGIVFGHHNVASSKPNIGSTVAEPFVARIYSGTVYIYLDNRQASRWTYGDFIIFGK